MITKNEYTNKNEQEPQAPTLLNSKINSPPSKMMKSAEPSPVFPTGTSPFLGAPRIPSISLGSPVAGAASISSIGRHDEHRPNHDDNDDHNNDDMEHYGPPPSSSDHHHDNNNKPFQHYYVLPVLLFEFLALSLTRAVLPMLLLQHYGNATYLVLGCADCIRGLLAFVACPFFGKVSDVIGRRVCLFVTVMGTCAPVCSLALFQWTVIIHQVVQDNNATTTTSTTAAIPKEEESSSMWHFFGTNDEENDHVTTTTVVHPAAFSLFIVLLCISGIFSSTFTLVFAYISDTVRQQEERVSAYGLALATFGLSYTIGPMAGMYKCSVCFTVYDK